MQSDLERTFAMHCKAMGYKPTREYRFAPPRRWKFDFAWKDEKIAVEIEGGIYTGGRHTRGRGFEADCEKYNAGTLAGWRIFRFSAKHVTSGEAIRTIEEALCSEK
jgi:very-short-patch-repair endonuclease